MHSILNQIIMPESIEKHGKNWKNVDYLVFNTYIWWINIFSMKVLRGSFDEAATEYDEIERPVAYRRVLTKQCGYKSHQSLLHEHVSSTYQSVGTDRRLFVVAANVTQSISVPVYFLNITTLSEYRKDAHTSVHTIGQGKMLSPEQQADPATYADCIHLCLPVLPDTWNKFLYSRILSHS
ncbi:hypothetical protein RND71_036686 [Anisodus tanguticus]|uniref:Trichome birefringence-like C-terminal domain-containing protein n=1 Tax=Anisodus tanguticus TaxID=243964 RepID=A0AAE1R4L2_9SOLA|nr:hypothetical protein RND71_036686 [Anisodus tanguticus]